MKQSKIFTCNKNREPGRRILDLKTNETAKVVWPVSGNDITLMIGQDLHYSSFLAAVNEALFCLCLRTASDDNSANNQSETHTGTVDIIKR